jgi:hypothetical protein
VSNRDEMNWPQVVSGIRRLNLPHGEFVIVGGAAMAARAIRDTDDVDQVVTRSLFQKLQRAGWRRKIRPNGKPGPRHSYFEAYLDVNSNTFKRSLQWLLAHCESIDGIPLVDLETLARFKASYSREKDIHDVNLIHEYFMTHRQSKLRDTPNHTSRILVDSSYSLGCC